VYTAIRQRWKMESNEANREKRDKSTKRKSILNAAIKVFLSVGFENASMDHIAEVAVASKRTVYNYFPSKKELLRAVIELFNDEMKDLKNIPYSSSRTMEDQLGDFIDAEIHVVQNPTWMGIIRFLVSVFISYPDIAKEAMAAHADSENGLTSWMHAAKDDGKLATDDYILASMVFSALIGGAFTWPSVYQGEFSGLRAMDLKQEIIKTFLARYGLNLQQNKTHSIME
jgi:TetR/AcrR family transcriptional regulator, regulator of autoinduction and epiphytic fitness